MAKKPKSSPKLAEVILPVFPSSDPVGRATSAAFTAQRRLEVSIRGERVFEQQIEVDRDRSHQELSEQLSLDELAKILLHKMYQESIADQTVYDRLFGKRLEEAWAREAEQDQETPESTTDASDETPPAARGKSLKWWR